MSIYSQRIQRVPTAVGLPRQISVDPATHRIYVHDGLTPGGFPVALQEDVATANDAGAYHPLNINGDHVVSQEFIDADFPNTGSAGGQRRYTTDGNIIGARGSSLVVNGGRALAGGPVAFGRYHTTTNVATQAVLGANDFWTREFVCEGLDVRCLRFGTAAAYPVSLCGYWNFPSAGTFCVWLANAARTRTIVKEVTSPGAGWNYFSKTFPGDQAGTWLDNTGVGLRCGITLAAGSSLTGTADSWQTAEHYATGNQTQLTTAGAALHDAGNLIIPGLASPPLERLPLFFARGGAALRRARRYWQKSYDVNTALGNATDNGVVSMASLASSATTFFAVGPRFPVAMRDVPTIRFFHHTTGVEGNLAYSYDATLRSAAASPTGEGENGFAGYTTAAAGMPIGGAVLVQYQFAVDARMGF